MTELPDRYELVREVPGRMFALDRERDEEVVIKELALGRITQWKELDLFKRETDLLRRLEHPAIPKMLDTFEGTGEVPSYYLVCEKVPGTPLLELEAIDEQRLIRIARRVLEVLEYLQAAVPPIVHRNITPEAILVHGEAVFLIDFGSVQVELQATMGGSTMVGTSGYMAPEQLLGRAVPASDIYALGATLVHALTRTEPAELPTRRMKLQWRDRATFGSDIFRDWVDRCIAPDPVNRFGSAKDAIRALGKKRDDDAMAASTQLLAQRPAGTAVTLTRRARILDLACPPPRLFERRRVIALVVMLAAIASVPFMGRWFGFALFVAAMGFGAVVLGVRDHLRSGPSQLTIDADKGYRLRAPDGTYFAGSFGDVSSVETGFGGYRSAIFLNTAGGMLQVGRGLSHAEIAWIRDEVAAFLKSTR